MRRIACCLCALAVPCANVPHASAQDDIETLLGEARSAREVVADAAPALRARLDAGGRRARIDAAYRLLRGAGVAADAEKARALLLDAVADGDVDAPLVLGVMHWNGTAGSAPDVTEALAWFELALARGNGRAAAYAAIARERVSGASLRAASERAAALSRGLSRAAVDADLCRPAPMPSPLDAP